VTTSWHFFSWEALLFKNLYLRFWTKSMNLSSKKNFFVHTACQVKSSCSFSFRNRLVSFPWQVALYANYLPVFDFDKKHWKEKPWHLNFLSFKQNLSSKTWLGNLFVCNQHCGQMVFNQFERAYALIISTINREKLLNIIGSVIYWGSISFPVAFQSGIKQSLFCSTELHVIVDLRRGLYIFP